VIVELLVRVVRDVNHGEHESHRDINVVAQGDEPGVRVEEHREPVPGVVEELVADAERHCGSLYDSPGEPPEVDKVGLVRLDEVVEVEGADTVLLDIFFCYEFITQSPNMIFTLKEFKR
jgi:hypothetical protein